MTAENLTPEHEAISKAWTVRIANIINRVAEVSLGSTVERVEDDE